MSLSHSTFIQVDAQVMEGTKFEEFVHIRPKAGDWVNMSRRVPSPFEQACRYLQKSFRDRKSHVLFARDVAQLTCATLLAIFIADMLTTLCTRKVKHVSL